ncbi:MAG TPA: adenylosuccinate lyase, partial [Candidatus Polarisedimenticolaceae bacterium]|nr:adenylosuccinate lyase [Candidatus Polarisedimenticolaceae bacterium]
MIERYTRAEMGALWTERAKFDSWLEVELAVCEVRAERGEIPADELEQIRANASFDIARIEEIERTVAHDVIAFLTSVAERIGPAARHVHYGLTSSDVVDTAQGLRTVRAADLLLRGLDRLIAVLKSQAARHKDTLMVGRTHGIHAEPYTLGLKFAGWYTEALRNRERLRAAREGIRVGKLSGSVGTYAHLGPEVELLVMDRLGLRVEPVSTQVVPRDRHAAFVASLGVLASSLDRITTEIRHLQRSDVREVEEPFAGGQKGSSSMPHKRNPVKSENVSGLARIVRSWVQAALEDVPLWHERDISHSSVERVMLPDVTILCDFMLHRVSDILERLHVYPERMRQNMAITRGLIFSQAVLLALTRHGMGRDDAYAVVQDNAMRTWAGEGDFRDLLAADERLRNVIGEEQLAQCFDPQR